ncbi:protein phosphatase 2C domain-containing protein [Sediminitomix flava]|uniref:Protein phosphatase 2C-like protein n=1 Tax=Sediminitomix flava TaxID=379075 RepID=A0A315ZC65_SEDFL|nr:protein phosphatase 2C domain-containing protein [Sediminitomix flava]PWJ43131.1 protein phosphatase 2C-like protein [Sediminitomix flava]
MKVYESLSIGVFHTNQCEDFLVVEQIASNKKLIAVLDGCTMGTESVFASMLYGKILRKVAKNIFYEEFVSKDTKELAIILRTVFRELFKETALIKNQLGLEINELLSTVILGVVNTEEAEAEFLTVGDGLVCIDGKFVEYEQDNIPDYLGYHLTEDFDTWYTNQLQRLSVKSFENLSICTDGIFTFQNLKNKGKQLSESEILNFLLINKEGSENKTFLEKRLRQLAEEYEHVPTDDLAIIRIMKI